MKCKWNNTICLSFSYKNAIAVDSNNCFTNTLIDVLPCKYRRNEITKQLTVAEIMNYDGNILDLVKGLYFNLPNHDFKTYHYCQSCDNTCSFENEPITRVRLSIERSCNLHCVMCEGNAYFKPIFPLLHEIQYNLQYKLLGYNNKLDQIILTSDGEPFFYKKELFEYIDKVTLNDTKEIYLFSNLTLINDKDIEFMYNYWKSTGVKINILASIDGITEETYKAVRRNNMFDKVITNALILNEHKMLDRVNFCVVPENIHELNRVRDYWAKYNVFVDVILGQDYLMHRKGTTNLVLNHPEWKKFIINEYT